MGIGGSIFLLALGAILTFAVDATVSGLDLAVVGVILMAAGLLGLIMFIAVFGPRSRRAPVVEESYVRERPVREVREVRDRDVY